MHNDNEMNSQQRQLFHPSVGIYTPLLLDTQITWADINLVCRAEFLRRKGVCMKVDWTNFPKLAALQDRVAKHPRIAAWIAKSQM